MQKTIGLVYDLRTDYLAEGYSEEDVAEFDSESTINALDEALRSNGYRTERVGHGRALCRRLVDGARWDLVFTIAEGLRGRSREAQVPAVLELFGVPYTFSDPLTCAITLDKDVTKRLVRAAGLSTADSVLVRRAEDIVDFRLPFPVFAKPVAEGTGKGVDGRSRIRGRDELAAVIPELLGRYRQPVLVERYLPGREFTTGILGSGEDAGVIGTLEVRMREHAPHGDYSYAMKEECERYVDYLPVDEGPERSATEELAQAAYRLLECRDAGRVDVRLDEHGVPAFLEVNPLPGLHPSHSDLPMIATAYGMPYEDLIGRIVESALRRAEVSHGTPA